jgi:hypothetical protein
VCGQRRVDGRRRFILGSGCTLAVTTLFENVDAMIAAARAQGS